MQNWRDSTARSAALTAALGLVAATTARADVIEVGEGGYTWVSGSSAVTASAPSPAAQPSVSSAQVPSAWAAHVATLSARYDLSPALIEALVWQESRWNAAAVSPKGARGLAQLMPETARQLGIDAADPLANLEGGARYLRRQIDVFDGDLEKALAAYNAGPARVQRAGGVPRIRETQGYVAAVMSRLNQNLGR